MKTVAIMTSPVFHQTKELNGEDRTIWGGAERYLLTLCALLQKMGVQVTLYQQLMPGVQNGKPALPRGRIEKTWMGVPVVLMPVAENVRTRQGMFPNFNAQFNELAGAADLRIYFVTSMAYPQVLRPCISISHGIYWDAPTGDTQEDGPARVEWLARMRESFLAADVCVAVDHNVKNVVRAMFTGVESAIQVIPNFVDTKIFNGFSRPSKTRERPVVLFPRRFTSVRGCNDFVQASMEIEDADFVACGQANTADMETALGHIPTIRYQWTTPEKMPDVYTDSDVALIPTKGAEGLSLSLLEAMACMVPIVTTMNGGLGDAVIPGYNALTYDPDHERCTEAIRRLLDDKTLAARLVKRSLDVAHTFDVSVWEERWTRLLKRFL